MVMMIVLLIDWIIGDFENWLYFVCWFGKWIYWIDFRLNKGVGRWFKGLFFVISMVVFVGVVFFLFFYVLYGVYFIVGVLVEGVMIVIIIFICFLSEVVYKV